MRSGIAVLSAAACIFVLSAPEAQPSAQRLPEQEPAGPTIRIGTRLVEVEVVVRDKNGPVKGLLRDDFTVLDQGKPQKIAVFTGSVATSNTGTPAPLPAGTVSNRADRSGHAVNGATVLLLDLLNTSLENHGYARRQIEKYLESADGGQPVAIYLLGKNLTILQDFTNNSATLAHAVKKWDPKNLFVLIQSDETMDETDRGMLCGPICQQIRDETTSQAIARITQHLSGMPGRRNLVWISDTPGRRGAQFLSMANIYVYPVLARGVGNSGMATWMRNTRESPGASQLALPAGNEIAMRHVNDALAAASGGVGFTDSRDISLAVNTAVEDAGNMYVLGFYPAEETLDNKFHTLAVKVGKKGAARGKALEIHTCAGYVATPFPATSYLAASYAAGKTEQSPADAILRNPLDATAVGITAAPGFADGQYQLTLTVDLRDIHFEVQNDRHVGMLALTIADEASRKVQTRTLKLSFTDGEITAAIEHGLNVNVTLDQKAAVRIVAQDMTTGVAGSLWIAVPETPPEK